MLCSILAFALKPLKRLPPFEPFTQHKSNLPRTLHLFHWPMRCRKMWWREPCVASRQTLHPALLVSGSNTSVKLARLE